MRVGRLGHEAQVLAQPDVPNARDRHQQDRQEQHDPAIAPVPERSETVTEYSGDRRRNQHEAHHSDELEDLGSHLSWSLDLTNSKLNWQLLWRTTSRLR